MVVLVVVAVAGRPVVGTVVPVVSGGVVLVGPVSGATVVVEVLEVSKQVTARAGRGGGRRGVPGKVVVEVEAAAGSVVVAAGGNGAVVVVVLVVVVVVEVPGAEVTGDEVTEDEVTAGTVVVVEDGVVVVAKGLVVVRGRGGGGDGRVGRGRATRTRGSGPTDRKAARYS